MPKAPRTDHYGPHRTEYLKNKKRVFASQDTCAICGKPVDFKLKYPHPMSACIDHIIPISRGGHPSDIANMQLAHLICNRQKSDKIPNVANKLKNESELPDYGKTPPMSNRDLPLSVDWINF